MNPFSLNRLITRHAGKTSLALVWFYAIVGLLLTVFGQETLALLSLIGLLYELNRMELAKLRDELHRKRMWHEGPEA